MKDKYLVSIVFITFISLICFFMVLSCSAEEEDTIPPTSTVQSTTPEPEPETPAPVLIQYTLEVTASEGGSVTNGGTFDEGTSVTITATPNEGYEFIGWDGNDSGSSNLSLTLNSNTTLEAIFQRVQFVSKAPRYSAINETTSNFYNQFYFESYMTRDTH